MRNIATSTQAWIASRFDRMKNDVGAMSVEWVGIVALLLIITGLTIEAVSDGGFLGFGANLGEQIANVVGDWVSQFEPGGRTE